MFRQAYPILVVATLQRADHRDPWILGMGRPPRQALLSLSHLPVPSLQLLRPRFLQENLRRTRGSEQQLEEVVVHRMWVENPLVVAKPVVNLVLLVNHKCTHQNNQNLKVGSMRSRVMFMTSQAYRRTDTESEGVHAELGRNSKGIE